MRPLGAVLAALLVMTGCGRAGGGNQAGAGQGRIVETRELDAVFLGWGQDRFGGLRLRVAGRELHVWSPDRAVSYFLDAHQGRPLKVRLETVETGTGNRSYYVRDAAYGELTATRWWREVGPYQRMRIAERLQHVLMEPLPE